MINSVTLVGRLTKEPELRKTQTGLSVMSFTVACDRDRKDAQGNKVTDYVNCVAWRQSADFLAQYAVKGSLVAVNGRIETRTYDKNDGTRGYATEVVADNVNILDNRKQMQGAQVQGTQPVQAQQPQTMYQQPVMAAQPAVQSVPQPQVPVQPVAQPAPVVQPTAQPQPVVQPQPVPQPIQQPVQPAQPVAEPMQPTNVYASEPQMLDISTDDLPF